MYRIVLSFMLMCASAMAQIMAAQPGSTSPKPPAAAAQPAVHPENVTPDTVVLEIKGLCSGLADGHAKESPCSTQITRAQFDAMVTAVGINSSALASPAARRSFAESYAQILALAEAASKAGIDKDPQFQELMRIVRVRTMAEAYRQFLQTRAEAPSQADIEAYYKQNLAKFEQIKLERVIVPPAFGRRSPNASSDVSKKARELANQIRERAVKGEDMAVLQAEVYKTLGLSAPPNTDMGARRRGTLPAALETELYALKPGEVTKVETEAAGYTIYRLRTHDTPSVDVVRNEIVQQLRQNAVTSALKAAQEGISTNLNMDYFGTAPAVRGAAAHPPAPARVGVPTAPSIASPK